MSQGDITRLNVMYKCPMTRPESTNQDKKISDNLDVDNSVTQYKRPSQNMASELPYNNNIINTMIQHGRYRQPSEVLMNNNNNYNNMNVVQQLQPSGIPVNSNVNQHGQQTQEIPNNSNVITDNQPQSNANAYEQKGSAMAPVQEAQSSQLPVIAEKSEKPCGSNIFMTFFFKIRPN